MSARVKPPVEWRDSLALSLTSQEKKVIGFIVVMAVLGLLMLGVKRFASPEPKADSRAVSAVPTIGHKPLQ